MSKSARRSRVESRHDEQVTHVGEILSEEIVEFSSVLDSSGSSTDNNERKETVDLLLTLTGKVGRLNA